MTQIYNSPILNNVKTFIGIPFKKGERLPFTSYEPLQDSFSLSSSVNKYFVAKDEIAAIAKSNPEVMKILRENKIPLKVNDKELILLKQGHLADTRVTSAKIYSSLPKELKENVNIADLQQAALLHDYGKVLIPEKVLNKKSQLTPEEREIMKLHSELGYELLKPQGVNKNVLNLVKYHHQTPLKNGYPEVNDKFEYDIASQILAAADKYSALREVRPYKQSLSREEALSIIRKDVDSGLISEDVYNALEKSV